MSSAAPRLTTKDNPYNPFTEFEQWFVFDVVKGYNTCGLLARISKTSSQLPDNINNDEIEHSIDEIIKYDVTDNYMKIYPPPEEEVDSS